MADTSGPSTRSDCSSTASSSRRASGQTFDERQPRHRGGARRRRRRLGRRHAPRHRRRPPGLRRPRLVHRPRLPQALPRAAAGRPSRAEREELREELILEVGCPRMLTNGPQLDVPLDHAPPLPGQAHRRVRVGDTTSPTRRDMRGNPDPPPGREGAGRRGRRHRAVELPVRGDDQQARPGPGHRQHGGAEAGARHAVERHPHRPADRRAAPTSRPASSTSSPLRPPRRRGADAVAPGRPHLLHRLHRGRQADHGEGRRHDEAPLPRAGRQVAPPSCSTTPTSPSPRSWASRCAPTPARAAPSPPGCCSPAPATTRASSSSSA